MPRPPKITNEAILTAARQVFLEQGLKASTVEIARRAGISEASVFKRFPTKQALFLAAMGVTETPDWVKRLSDRQPTANIKAELTEICGEMLAFYQEGLPRVFMMMAQKKMPHPPHSPHLPPPPVRDSRLLALFLERAVAGGWLRAIDSMALAHLLVGSIINYVIAHELPPMVQSMPQMPPFTQRPTAIQPESQQPEVKPESRIEPSQFVASLINILWAGIAPENSPAG
ncbi:TetR/AcrR family transcriptional regulator [Limnothrix sp. FACHB-1083]|uniref:TetR/AcrR family transcriptional regulator n=1 Tax=Limnothrix sp. FACHB-1088 TaxID=2692816 RepID=UPI0016803211|nr:TetR/AcrR family transcriptional regulator [Limnothrix sp. FACHB-1088]MBD2159630.1 TetR/AcrR family transcriptional regulator [Limnothrix sp. FACHB-1083]MBD2190332.1 TetR/AcrR family transcriptional regulator [Limnothrix sp. FACHB-1088]